MTDTAVENAASIRDDVTAKIAAAEAKIKEWKATLARAERFIADWEEFSGLQAPAAPAVEPAPVAAKAASPKSLNPKKEAVAERAREILLAHGTPMSRDDLFAAITRAGVVIHGSNPPVVLQTMMWRMGERIAHIKGFGYWPKDVEYEPAGYDPAVRAEIAAKPDSDLGDLLK